MKLYIELTPHQLDALALEINKGLVPVGTAPVASELCHRAVCQAAILHGVTTPPVVQTFNDAYNSTRHLNHKLPRARRTV